MPYYVCMLRRVCNVHLLIMILLLIPAVGDAEFYKHIEPDGSVSYSDRPQSSEAEAITPPGLTPLPATKIAEPVNKKPPATDAKKGLYSNLKIIAPQPNATIRNNNGMVRVVLQLSPPLMVRIGHRISIVVDGKPRTSDSVNTKTVLSGLDRGMHTIVAKVVDASGKKLIESAPGKIIMRRMSVLHLNADGSKKPSPTAPVDNQGNSLKPGPGDPAFKPGPFDSSGKVIRPGPANSSFKPGPIPPPTNP